jgi:hypothetical protein
MDCFRVVDLLRSAGGGSANTHTVVYSSLDPERIQTTTTSPWGLRALKEYLIFARTGILDQADEGVDQPTNAFECSVGAVLKENGHEVVAQVGVAGFFIDLGCEAPDQGGHIPAGHRMRWGQLSHRSVSPRPRPTPARDPRKPRLEDSVTSKIFWLPIPITRWNA